MARKSQPVKKPTAKQTAAQKRQTQNRREIWALVCIFLAIFSMICCLISRLITDWKSRTIVGNGYGPITEPST